MAITIPTLDELDAQVFAYLRNRFPSRDTGTESFLGKWGKALSMALLGLARAIQAADRDAIPSSASSTAALDAWAILLGISNGASGYGRKAAVAATGGGATLTGTRGTAYLVSTQGTANDGTIVELRTAVTIAGAPPGTGSVAGIFDAVTAGVAGNLPVGAIITWSSPPAGADATFTLTTALSGGKDGESDAELLVRVLARLQQPPKGGTASDYRYWAEAASPVVFRAYPYPLRGGLGSCHLSLTANGSGATRDPGATVKTLVDNYINGSGGQEGTRPITSEGFTSYRPYMPASRALTIRTRLVPSSTRYAFDWVDTAASYTVAAYTAGPPTLLELNIAAPATLQAAISAGSLPRLQVLETGGPAVSVPVRCTAYNVGTKELTLENPLPDGWIAPTPGDVIYAGGPMVTQIATALLAYVDGLGCARGVYAASTDAWEDTVAIARLTQIALDAADADGQRYASNIVGGGVTIAIGAGAPAATDVQAQDNTSYGPELLYAKWIAVTA